MIYNIEDKLPIKKLLLFSAQMMLAVFTATVLIANVCGVATSGALVGAGLATIIYALVTGFKSPMYVSNSGAFVAPVLAALAAGGYTAIAIGGVVACAVYCLFGLVFTKISADKIYKVLPKVLIGSITIVIGVNLMGFITSYVGTTNINLVLALVTMLTIALSSHYFKGVLSLIPFLIGILVGYLLAIPFGLVDFTIFNDMHLFRLPDFAFTHFEEVDWAKMISIIILFAAYTVSAICECLSDHAALGNIVGRDLYKNPGLNKIFFGEGLANLSTSLLGGLGACSYGEGIATVGFSKCASIYSTIGAAVLMVLLGFIEPVQLFIESIPMPIIGGGTAFVLYGFISSSGIKRLKDVDLDNTKNLIICSVVMAIGISGVVLGNSVISITGTALALVVGVVLNLILK